MTIPRPSEATPGERYQRPSRAVAEERYDLMLRNRCAAERVYADDDLGGPNKRWLKLTKVISELVDGTAMDVTLSDDVYGDILEEVLVGMREIIVAGVAGEMRP